MGYRIKQRREELHMTQEMLAQRSGVSRQTICSLESADDKNVTTSTLAKVARALETTIGELFFDDGV